MKRIARLIGFYLNLLAWIAPRTAGRIGFNLFCTPIPPPVKDHHKAFFETAEQKRFLHEGVPIQTYRWGNGPRRILFVHGWQSHSFRWKAYIEYFLRKGDYTVFAIDAPAHGLSGGKYINLPYYSAVVSHFIRDIQPVHAVISHSFGSFAMLHAFHENHNLPVQRLVITGTPGEAEEFFKFYRTTLGLSARTTAIIRRRFVEVLNHDVAYYSSIDFAKSVPVPGLIVHDIEDEETPYHFAMEIHDSWPTSRLVTTTGLGHNLKSKEVIETIAGFVDERVDTKQFV